MADRVLTVAVFSETSGWSMPEPLVERLRRAAPDDVDVHAVRSRGELLAAIPDTDYLLGMPLTESQFMAGGGRVRWVQLTGPVGESLAPISAALEAGVRITTAVSIRAPHCAEHAIALTLALMRRLDLAILAQADHRWDTAGIARHVRDLDGATVGLIGIDAVAAEIAPRMKAFGCEVIAAGDHDDGVRLHVDEILPLGSLDELLSRADVVIVTNPVPDRPPPLLRRAELDSMRSTAFLVDVSRGGLVSEPDLVAALRKGEIAGAALDVFETEPLSRGSSLWSMRNVIITPHVSIASPRYWERAMEVTAHNLARITDGRPLIDELRADIMLLTTRRRR